LHDRWLLPHFIREDFADVLADMADAGYALDAAWFAPHVEFRFPKVGEFAARGVHVTLRGALEPWHVMGEEGSAGGTVRYVDASLERLEVHVTGLVDPRHRITVNGQPLPLQPTGRVGEFVCGVRYRAWLPASALHPTIGIHAPLTLDLVDTWQHKSLGGCRYFVAHPATRAAPRRPDRPNDRACRRRDDRLAGAPPRHVTGRVGFPGCLPSCRRRNRPIADGLPASAGPQIINAGVTRPGRRSRATCR